MIDEKTYNRLIEKLDSYLQVSHPCPGSAGSPDSVGLLLPETDISEIPNERLSLVHTMLHMFYENKNGKGLTPKTIEKLHKELVERLPTHKKYDRLDKKNDNS